MLCYVMLINRMTNSVARGRFFDFEDAVATDSTLFKRNTIEFHT
jgi:hypothetical protein